jgi:hypothetical protein
MGAGASSELPSVSVDDLSPMRPHNMAPGDSAAYRADAMAGPRDEKKKNTGLVLGIIGTVLAVVAVAVLVINSGDGDEKPNTDTVADKGKSPPPEDPQDSKLDLPSDTGPLAADAGEVVATDGGEPTDEGGPTDEGEATDESSPTDDGGEVVETDGGGEPDPSEPDPGPKPIKPKNPPPPTEPKLPPDQALAEARKASLTGNNKKAYSLAKDAYDQNKSSEALSVMGVAACKMGSETKAKSAYKKMTVAKDKQTLEKVCAPLGIELE